MEDLKLNSNLDGEATQPTVKKENEMPTEATQVEQTTAPCEQNQEDKPREKAPWVPKYALGANDDDNPYADEKDTKIKGWLGFFLYVTVGLGMVVSTCMTLYDLSTVGYQSVLALMDISTLCIMLVVGISTIIAFHKRKPNAVALAKSYMFIVLAVNIFSFVLSITMADGIETSINPMVSLIGGNIIWIIYLFVSNRVRRVIPESTRTTGRLVKVVWVLFVAVMAGQLFTLRYMPDNISKLYFSDQAYIEAQVAGMYDRTSDSSGSVEVSGHIEGSTIVLEIEQYVRLSYMQRLEQPSDEHVQATKRAAIRSYSNEDMLREFFVVLANNGYDILMKYNINNGDVIYEYRITNEEINQMVANN